MKSYKSIRNIYLFAILMSLVSCGNKSIESKEEAIKYLEGHHFHDESAYVKGKSSDESISTGFSLEFENGNVKIGNEVLPYKIGDLTENVNSASYDANRIKGFEIEFCGSERYAYGGCIKCYLDCGEDSEDGPSLKVEGDYVNAYFLSTTEGSIIEK